MIFSHRALNKTLEWNENTHLCELVVENPYILRQVLHDFSIVGEELRLSFMENGEALSLEKDCDVIFNPLRLDFNNRRATTALLKLLVKTSLSEDFYLKTNSFKTGVIKYLDQVVDSEGFNFEVSSGEFNIDDIAKAANLHIVGDEDDFVELVADYMSMMSELAAIKVFVFVSLRSLLSKNEFERFYHDLDNHQINVLLVENYDRGRVKGVPRIVLDRDMCEL